MEQSHCETYIHCAYLNLLNSETHYHLQDSQPLHRIVSQLNPFYISIRSFLNIYFNTDLLSSLFLWGFAVEMLLSFLIYCMRATRSTQFILLHFIS